ncbi:hypothetical protein FRB90_011562 [Tulasnella sp. 427]|nr:hypothetical protein FRB90_011562 [Tulasnella sp. 427]
MSHNSLPDLPVEVWQEIIQYIRHVPRTVPDLSLVCRNLRQICRPFIFERIVFDGYSGLGRAYALFNLFKDNPDMRSWVKELRISSWAISGAGMPAGGLVGLARAMEEAFTELHNLRALEIVKTFITPKMWCHIGGSTHLRRLSLPPSYISEDVSEDCFNDSKLEEVKLCYAEGGKFIPAQSLKLLSIANLEVLRIDVWLNVGVGKHLEEEPIQSTNPSNLRVLDLFLEGTTLRMGDNDLAAVGHILTQYPLVAELKTPDTMEVLSASRLSEHLGNNIEKFHGRPGNVDIFCRHCPLRLLSLSSAAAFELKEVHLTAGPFQLRSLSLHGVSWEYATMGLIERHCPQLEELHVFAWAYAARRMREEDVPNLPSLKSVVLLCRHTSASRWFDTNSSSGWWDDERAMLERTWGPGLPMLARARFNGIFEWKLGSPADGWIYAEGRDLGVTTVRDSRKSVFMNLICSS